jgi:hypothetical protein
VGVFCEHDDEYVHFTLVQPAAELYNVQILGQLFDQSVSQWLNNSASYLVCYLLDTVYSVDSHEQIVYLSHFKEFSAYRII